MRRQPSLYRALMIAALMLSIGGSAFAQAKPAAKAPSKGPVKPVAWAIEIEPVASKDGQLPADFAMAIYERLVQDITKSNKFQQVFRSGDRRATDAPNLLILTTTLEEFKHGSETKRAVTTVGGATEVAVHVQLATRDSHVKLGETVKGSVRLFGGNLNATQNLANNITDVINQLSL